jgi:hypothetical protein
MGNFHKDRPAVNDTAYAMVDNKEEVVFSGRGVLKMLIFSFIEEPTAGKKVIPFTKEVCKVISTRGYGKSAKTIFREIGSMNVDQAQKWIEDVVWDKYINANDIMNLFNAGRIV